MKHSNYDKADEIVSSYTEYADGHVEFTKKENSHRSRDKVNIIEAKHTNDTEEIKRIRKLSVLVFSLIFACIFGAMAIFFMYKKIQILDEKNNKLEVENSSLESELSDIKKELTEANELSEKMSKTLIEALEQNIFFDNNVGIVTSSGEKYHTYSCHHWKYSDEIYIYNIELAEYYGYEPCLDCH